MNFNKLTISDLVDQQLPSFIVDEFPTFVKFFEEYYKSLEISGGILDIQNNFLEYTNVDNLRKFNLVKTYKLQTAVDATATSIVVDKIDGLSTDGGIIGIGSELIYYKTVDISTQTLNDCERGYSATEEFDALNTTVQTSTAQSHEVDAVVTNYSNLILFFVLRNYEKQYLAGFPHENISDQIGKDTLIRNIKDFYSYKGTDLSIQFLFRALFDEEVTVRYPKDRVIKASFSDFTVDDIIKVETISGDPYDLVGSQIRQTDATGVIQATAIIDDLLVNNISNYASGAKNIYEVRLNVLDSQPFTIPQESILRHDISATDTVITVDSTLSFPKLNGVIEIDGEFITYRTKTFNQFIDCGRGVYGTNAVSHSTNEAIRTTEYIFGFAPGKTEEVDEVRMRVLGVLSEVRIDDGSNYFQESEKIKLSADGASDDRQQFTSWRLNEVGNRSSSADLQIDNAVENIPTEVFAVFKDSNYAYVTSAGLPGHPIGNFVGTGFDIRNQNILKSFPLVQEKNTQIQTVGDRPVGLFINGVEAFSAEDYEVVPFGTIDSVSIAQSGFGFEEDIQPIFRVKDATGNGATFNASVVDGRVTSISVVDGGSNYTADHELEVTYGFNATASITQDIHLIKGEIKTITVANGGQDYVATPNVEIIDTSGRGKGAFAIAEVTNNQVTGIVVLNGGTDYTDISTIQIRIVSKGSGVFATANVKKWSFDRVFKTKYSLDLNQNWIPVTQVKSDTGNGYLYPSRNAAYGLQYGYPQNPKILRNQLADNVLGVNANYAEKSSGFVHSPILAWAYDGNPIYGPYGYVNAVDETTSIVRQTSSYALKSSIPSTRPSTAKYPLGAFVEDYEFVQGNGSLDFNNGRFCKTPEFPEGRYCYFLSVDSFGAGVYPYILGRSFQSVPSENNYDLEFDQSNDSNIPESARRIRTPNTPSKGFDASLVVGSVERGSVDSFTVTESGNTFKNNDFLYIDNTDTEGSRLFGRVFQINGKNVPRVAYQVASGSTIPATNGIPDAPWPAEISNPQYADTKYAVIAETSEPHGLSEEDLVTISLDLENVNITKNLKVRVSDYQTITYNRPSITTSLEADVAFNATNLNVVTVDSALFRENDYIKINDEILKITAIDTNSGQLTVDRNQFSTPLRLHATTNTVTLHIPDDQPDYRIAVGDTITSPGVAGVIYNIDKVNSTIDVRVTSGTITNSINITDTSTPTGRQIDIASVTEKSVYWEIDPTGTGNYYVRDLQFRFIRGSKYVFDLSDGSNLNHNLVFSEDSSNVNTFANVTYVGTPGTPGATATVEKSSLLDTSVSRVYYYDEKGGVLNNRKYFNVLLLPAGTQKVNIVDPTKFQFFAPFQPEVTEWLNLVSYKTTSLTSTGSISDISVIDGGEGYKKLPKIEGITHSLLDDFRSDITLVNGSISSITVLSNGSRYSSSTKLFVNTNTGSGAKLTPVIINERIVSVTVDSPGNGYADSDTITAVDTNAKIFAEGSDIGKVKTVRFSNNGSQFTSDRTLSKSLLFNKKVIIKGLGTNTYKLAEIVTTPGGFEAKVEEIKLIGNEIYLLNLFVINGDLKLNDVLTGQINQYTSTVAYVTNPDIIGLVNSFIGKVGFYDSDLGKISSSSQKITDSKYFQDFSYVIRSTRGLSDYKQYVDETTHPLGFKLFGEVAVENDVDFQDTVTGNPFSIGLANDPHANEVIIQLPNINVESDIVFKKYEVSRIKTANIKAYGGTGAARLNFLDNQIESTRMADISASFDGLRSVFTLSTNDGNFPTSTSNTSVMVALNEVFQEPYQTQNITGISYDAGMMTVTTDGDHGLAVTVSGKTYPDQKYVHVSNVVNSVANINFNDKFEIYDVPTSNSFRATINNPNGTLTNNNPAVCADVQSTIDNLTTILTYYTANPSATRPVRNGGVWLDPTKGPVSANRHRDGANLINANKFEIIDRANAEISLQYPDFFYPNDPQTNGYSRYRDAYRLIMINRKELVDRGAAQIAVDYPDFVYPLDPTTASDYRFKDAYRLIQQNRTEIVNNSWTTMQGGSNPADAAVETKCKRDIGLFIDYTSLDLVNGGNEYARKFALQYFDDAGNPLTNGLLGEELASVDGFTAAKDNMILAFTNQLTITDTTITADPAGAPLCANVTSAITVLAGIVNDAITAGSTAGLPTETIGSDRIGEAKCKRDIGLFVDAMALDIHTGGNVYARKFLKQYFNASGTTFITNGLDGEILQSVTAFNKVRDLMKQAIVNQLLQKDLTITAANANYWGTAVGTPTDVAYTASTGVSVITIANHGLSNGDDIVIKSNGLTFSCGMDGNVAEKSYPRLADGNHEQALTVSNVTNDTFEVNVGASPIVNYQVSNATYDPVSGDVTMDIGAHSLRAGTSIKLRDEALTFTCSLDNDQTQHSYPKTTILNETVSNAVYNPSDGVLTVTVDNHGWENGDFIKFDDDSLVFTCARDGNQTEHTYPRSTDPVSGKWIAIYDVYYDSFKVKVGVSSDTSNHTFVRSTLYGLKKKKDKTFDTAVPIVTKTATTITINVGSSTDTSVHTFVSALSDSVISGGGYTHTFIKAATDAIVRPVVNAPITNSSNGACADVQSNIDNVVSIVTLYLNQGSLVSPLALPIESMRVPSFGEGKCKRDLGIIVDAIIADMRSGGNSNILEATERYINGTSLLTNGIAGELAESTTAFNKARDLAKLAITNQLYNKDFTILPDFLTTSGTLDSSDVTNALYVEGQFKYLNSDITFYEKPKTGTTFYSTFYKFVDGADDARYSYKLKDILFDGTTKKYDLLKKNGSNVVTEADENLLIFVDGVMQMYGESYTIDRSVNPNQIVFNHAFERERHFYGYTFSKYKMLNNFSHLLDGSRKSFELQFGSDNIIPPDVHQILVLLDGVPQSEGVSYNIIDNVLTFTEAPQIGKNCHCLYFYGKTFDKTISIWNGDVYEDLQYIGEKSPDGCRYRNKTSLTKDIIFPGDLIKIDGETPKEIIRIDQRALENTDNLLYTAFVYTDNSYIRGKNAVANATVTGVTVSGGNTVGVSGTVGIQNSQGVPPVFDYQVTGVQITNAGLEYDVAPEVLFKVACDNPGTGAEAYAEITNGKITNVVITNGGSGYTEAPELIFAKKYEIIRPKTPIFTRPYNTVVMNETSNAGLTLNVNNESEVEDILPLVVSQITAERTTHVETQVKTNKDITQPGLAYNLNTFDQIKFQFEPTQLNDPLANYLGTGVTIEHMTRYAPNITIGDFTTHAGVPYGSAGGVIINLPVDAYVAYGLTLNGSINDTATTVTVTGNVANFPPAGYLEFGDETMEYTSISGQDFTVVRGSKGTTASAQADGDYLRLAWRG
nr:strucutural protein [uncultured Mediterranean phage uvMED]